MTEYAVHRLTSVGGAGGAVNVRHPCIKGTLRSINCQAAGTGGGGALQVTVDLAPRGGGASFLRLYNRTVSLTVEPPSLPGIFVEQGMELIITVSQLGGGVATNVDMTIGTDKYGSPESMLSGVRLEV